MSAIHKDWQRVVNSLTSLVDKNKINRHDLALFVDPFITRDVHNLIEAASLGDVNPMYSALSELKDTFKEVDKDAKVATAISNAMATLEPHKTPTVEERLQALEIKAGLREKPKAPVSKAPKPPAKKAQPKKQKEAADV